MSRRSRIGLGALLVTAGLTGILVLGPVFPVAAQPADTPAEAHETMDAMMDAMHGPGTADRMHQIPGVEEMMDQGASMMAPMSGMMDGGMMGG